MGTATSRGLPNRIVVRFEHLPARVQQVIGTGKLENVAGEWLPLFGQKPSIQGARKLKAIDGTLAAMSGSVVANTLLNQATGKAISLEEAIGGGTTFGFFARGRGVQNTLMKIAHKELLDAMRFFGAINPNHEVAYPKNWINPADIARTHPIVYVNRKGDLVFLKNSRAEYYRFKYQQKFGRSMWRWRGYLAPPAAPEKVKDWAKAQLEKVGRKLNEYVPRPAPVPVPVRAFRKGRR